MQWNTVLKTLEALRPGSYAAGYHLFMILPRIQSPTVNERIAKQLKRPDVPKRS